MKAVVALAGGELAIEDREIPRYGPDEVLVRVTSAACNRADLLTRSGGLGALPLVLGIDGAGIVEEVGSAVEGLRPADRVVLNPVISCGDCRFCRNGEDGLCQTRRVLGQTTDGTFAEFVVVPAVNAHRLDERVPVETAAAFGSVFYTSWHVLVTRAAVQSGETVLITAGGSGVGTAAIQLAKRLGLRVLTTAGSPEKLERLPALGADLAVNHSEDDWADRLLDAAGHVDAIIDITGGSFWDHYLRLLRPGGRMVAMSLTTGYEAKVDISEIMRRQLSILGSGQQGAKPEVRAVVALVNDRAVSPVIDSEFAFPAVAEAHTRLKSRDVFGRIVIRFPG